MGGSLFEEFASVTATADTILGYSIRELCLEDPRSQLSRTEFTQPALYVVNALSYYKKMATPGSQPDFLVGHSLGEINALLAAECFDFATGLRLVHKRGELMSRISGGAMAAVVNTTKEEIEAILQENGLGNIDLANYNTPTQIVISGLAAEISQATPVLQQGRRLVYPLNTSGAFHSRFMQGVEQEFRQFLTGLTLSEPKIPVIANVTARPYRNGSIRDILPRQIASTVRWCDSVQYLMALGAERGDTMQFEEVGHGDVLTRLSQTIRRQTRPEMLSGLVDAQEIPTRSEAPEARVDVAAEPVPLAAGERVAVWNRKYPIGTRVRSLSSDYASLETRSPALVLFGHRAAVYMKGYNGYFDLNEIVPV
jgi:malonyl CoA-acyl carrier protein transacylase